MSKKTSLASTSPISRSSAVTPNGSTSPRSGVDYHQDERSQHATHQQTLTPPLAPRSMTTRQGLLLRDLASVVLGSDPWQVPNLDIALVLDFDARQVLTQLLRDLVAVALEHGVPH
ncbi:hypothetical protein PC129_g1687 [Phytophthora cactorum]|uniref:Uncharacterized protein n=1 Tax=Phytophthora cactorum TaxID=29920 RepID=A0A329T6I7_9STRA|nr:hypothetical protein Pcac1_g2625 [Phytophthora cactorum]KAG2840614.1 hypothetical protein PC112_g3664 [Phytophthora cactorum]KAG2842244.1 hypothetical protein PC111_g2802 [Phytophthora cactorum]KAG2869220.1 hypothetical protein PC113_g446 [Phytophthora cactorum]KAG2924723.1 hypothetical protein PC114_g4399 [Phytophthora cactorum]